MGGLVSKLARVVGYSCLPVGVQNHGSVTPTQGDALWELAPFLKRNDGKCTTTACFPIDRDVFGVDLDDTVRPDSP